MRPLMYLLALALITPLVLTTAALPLWAGWQVARSITSGEHIFAWGLDAHGLYWLGLAVSVVLWKFTAPALAIEVWPIQRISAAICVLTWIGAVVGSVGFVVIASGAPLSALLFQANPALAFAVSWLLLDTIASLLPAALMSPETWRRLPTVDRPALAKPNDYLRATSPPAWVKDDLFCVLGDLALRGPGHVVEDVYVTCDGTIVTSQGTLAHLLHVSKSTINREIKALSAEGRIGLVTSPRDTKITIL